MNDGLVALTVLVGSSLVMTWIATYGWSFVARERFLTEMTILAGEIEDDVFSGFLPDTKAVQFAWAKARGVAKYARMVSYSTALATEVSARHLIGKQGPSYAGMTPAQRKRMHAYEDRFVDSMARYLVHGSRHWFVQFLMPSIFRMVKRPEQSPEKLAKDLSRAMERAQVETPKGPRVSFDLIPH